MSRKSGRRASLADEDHALDLSENDDDAEKQELRCVRVQ
jgi:hypothetical protein